MTAVKVLESRNITSDISLDLSNQIEKSVDNDQPHVIIEDGSLLLEALALTGKGKLFSNVRMSLDGAAVFRIELHHFRLLREWRFGNLLPAPVSCRADFGIVVYGSDSIVLCETVEEAEQSISYARADGYKGAIRLYRVVSGFPELVLSEDA